MSEDESTQEPEIVENGIKGMHIKNGYSSEEEARISCRVDRIKQEAISNGVLPPRKVRKSSTDQSPSNPSKSSQTPNMIKDEYEEVIGGDITVKMEPGQPPKLARTSSQKITPRAAPLFHTLPSKTDEAIETFQVLPSCTYTSKYIGSTEHALDCDCTEEWDNILRINTACGDDSDCINRATKMECYGDCGCGNDCQNQRFQRRQYAKVTVIKTEKKGYGLRADTDLRPNDFVYEYIGEVINETHFRRRMVQYDDEGIKHFYFMSLTKGEFVDATKKGNLGRFCNHSCNPNCYVDKWVVGDKLRMGIFAEQNIKAGEELVFNYNVDRYGADPQPCYCGEPNCSGYIGGKTQTERAAKLSNTTIEALGIDDAEGWDTAVAKKPRKKKVGEDDEEYVNNVQPKSLDETGVTKVMATLMQCKEKWIAVKLLGRIQQCDDERVRNRVVKMHGYQILNSALAHWKEDFNVALQILDILNHFPRLTRNKISDSKIESTVESLRNCGDERVESQAATLIQEWSTLEVAYRIPRKKRDPNAFATATPDKPDRFARRGSRDERKARSKSRSPSRSSTASVDALKGPAAPTGPRAGVPPRPAAFYAPPRPPYRPRVFNPNVLPPGWFSATSNGSTYYYSATGQTTWTKPTTPAQQQPPPPPPRPVSTTKALEDIINEITQAKANTPKDKTLASATPSQVTRDTKGNSKEGKEKWRSYPEEKQKKLYENTLFPHIKHVMDKFKGKLPKDDLKRFAKEIGKKLVNSDFKNKRVTDPTRISSHQEAQVKKFVKDYFTKAVAKKDDFDKKKAEKDAKAGSIAESPLPVTEPDMKIDGESDGDQGMDMSDDEAEESKIESTPITPVDQMINGDGLKRKRLKGEVLDTVSGEGHATPTKRLRSTTPPPPPPPPPPEEDAPDEQSMVEGEDGPGYQESHYSRQEGELPDMDTLDDSLDTTDSPLSPAINDQPRRNDFGMQDEISRGCLIEHSQQLEVEGGA